MGHPADLVEEGHADGDAVGDLFLDDRAVAVGEARADLDALVHGAGMHDEGAWVGAGHAAFRHLPAADVLPEAGEEPAGLPLALEAEGHDYVSAFHSPVEIGFDADGGQGVVRRQVVVRTKKLRREEGRRSRQGYLRTGPGESPEGGAGDPAVEDVSHDDDLETFQPSQLAADGVQVEQGLGRVGVKPVAGIDDTDLRQVPGQEGWGPRSEGAGWRLRQRPWPGG